MKNKYKLCYVIESFNIGGREKVISDLCNLIDKSKYEVTLVVLSNDRIAALKLINSNIKVYCLNIKSSEFRSWKFFTLGTLQLYKILMKIRPNIIHTHMNFSPLFMTSVVMRFLNFDYVHIRTVHTSGLFYKNQDSYIDKLRLMVEKISHIINKTYLVSISSEVHRNNFKYFEKNTCGIYLIFNGVNLNIFNRERYAIPREDFNLNNDHTVITYVARLDEGKNHDFLIKIWPLIKAKAPNAVLCFLGDGDLKNKLMQNVISRNLSKEIRFFGSIDTVAEFLSITDLAVFPSSMEGFSLVMLEKLAMKIPIVASDINAFKEICTNCTNAFLVSLDDQEQFIARIVELYKNKKLRESIGYSAREIAKHYDINIFLNSHEKVYEKLLNELKR